jgi:hypothetical protein
MKFKFKIGEQAPIKGKHMEIDNGAIKHQLKRDIWK